VETETAVSAIDQLFVWVKDPSWPIVLLIVIAAVLAWLLYRSQKRIAIENESCWELYGRSQKDLTELTGFLAEAITLASAPRSKQHSESLITLKVKVDQFKEEKSREYARDEEKRRNRNK
jgi:hypothetical protein